MKDAQGKVHIEATKATIDYLKEMHYHDREMQALDIWDTPSP